MQHRQTVMNGQINSLHFIMISFAVSHCHLNLFLLLAVLSYIHLFSSFPSYIYLCDLGKLGKPTFPSFRILPRFLASASPSFPLSFPSSNLSTPPPPPPSTLMRSRMTMNTPIIMRKQQAFPPPSLHPLLPKQGPPINR